MTTSYHKEKRKKSIKETKMRYTIKRQDMSKQVDTKMQSLYIKKYTIARPVTRVSLHSMNETRALHQMSMSPRRTLALLPYGKYDGSASLSKIPLVVNILCIAILKFSYASGISTNIYFPYGYWKWSKNVSEI